MKLRIALCCAALVGACGSPPEKGPASNDGNYVPPVNGPANSQTGRMEPGSPDNEVIAAFNRIWPLMCEYDATCPEPNLQEACQTQQVPTGDLQGQCWVVNQAKLTECESALRGLQCTDNFANVPLSCGEAMRQCACLDGYEQGWDDDGMGCFLPCSDSDDCGSGEACYDGLCTGPQEGRCPDGQILTFDDNGGERCADECSSEDDCSDGQICNGFLCADPPTVDVDMG